MYSRRLLTQFVYHLSRLGETIPSKFAHHRQLKLISSQLPQSFVVSSRTVVKMANKQVDVIADDLNDDTAAVIRYQSGDERFQMQITLKTGKVFNFDRSASDSVAAVVSRIVTNIGKKKKGFGGTVKFLTEDAKEMVENEGECQIGKLLDTALSASSSLKIQVDEDVYEVVMNPPEIYAVKFLSPYLPTFPLFPYRMETSNNFDKAASQYKWEFTRNKPTPPPSKSKKAANPELSSKNCSPVWSECSSNMIFTPEVGMEGGYLRFSCRPSNGKMFGRQFQAELPNQISRRPVDTFLYEERQTRLSPKQQDGNCLRVVTYNVLADCYATPEWFISSPKECLDVGYRLPILNKEIAAYQGDLICLQEVDEKFFEGNFEPYLSTLGFKGRHTSKTGNTKEGIATFHNPTKLTELEFTPFVILEHMKKLSLWEKLKSVGNDFVQRMEDRNTVFQTSVFQVNGLQTILVVGNVHLYFHPDADHIRLLQTVTCICILENQVAQLKLKYPDQNVTVVFCGDLNCTPPFSSYRLLTSGQVLEEDEDWTSHPEEKISPGLNVKHSLKLTNSHPGEELTNITTCFEGCLDYILYQEEHFELLSTCPPPDKEKLATLTNTDDVRKVSLPNFYTPSDHLPLIADLRLKI